jgi:hypothetical protein
MTDLFIRRMKDAADRAGTCRRRCADGFPAGVAGRHARREAAAFGAGGAGWVRLSYAASDEDLHTAMERMKPFIEKVNAKN